MNDFKKGGFKKGGGDFGGRPKFGNKFGGEKRFGNKFGGGKFGGEKKFGNKFGNKFGGARGGDRPFARPELFPATCSSCGKPCEVPFRPTGEKPVYCRDCFQKQDQAPWRSDERRAPAKPFRPREDVSAPRGGGDIDGLKYRLTTLESKVDRMLEILSKGEPKNTPSSEEAPKAKVLDKKTALAPKKARKTKK